MAYGPGRRGAGNDDWTAPWLCVPPAGPRGPGGPVGVLDARVAAPYRWVTNQHRL